MGNEYSGTFFHTKPCACRYTLYIVILYIVILYVVILYVVILYIVILYVVILYVCVYIHSYINIQR